MTNKKLPSPDAQKFQAWEGSSVFVSQGRHWSSAFIWLTAGIFGTAIIFAFTSKLDQTVSVRGQLAPSGSVKEIESPSSGVVLDVFVEEGQYVTSGDKLLTVQSKALSSQRQEVLESRQLLSLEIKSLENLIDSKGFPDQFLPLPDLPPVQDPVLLNKLLTSRSQILKLRSELTQLSVRLASRTESLNLKSQIAKDLKPLFTNGAMARNAYLEQINQLQIARSEVLALKSERQKILGIATTRLNQLNIQDLKYRTQLATINESISNRTLKAPVSGTVFNLQASPYSVLSASELLLKIVPSNNLQAIIEIPNTDIGFIKLGQKASIAVDSFPSGEFGYIDGSVKSIGSDALPPDADSPQRYFPGVVSLKQQQVMSGDKKLNLQSGMGVTANIKLRSRPAITILTDIFTRQVDGIKRFR